MSDNPNRYNFPYRTNFEGRIFAVWILAALVCFLSPYVFDVPYRVYWAFSLCFVVVGLVLGRHGVDIFFKKSKLKGHRLEFIKPNSHRELILFGNVDKKRVDKEVVHHVKTKRK